MSFRTACVVKPRRRPEYFEQTDDDDDSFKSTITTLAYPWDKSSLKSLEINLKSLERVDAHARKVDVQGSAENLVTLLLKEAHTELEKVRVLWMWICHHIAYDTTGSDPDITYEDLQDILVTRKDVCEGYAGLFRHMCSFIEVPCVTISGFSKGQDYEIGQKFTGVADHAWNAVYLEERWHLLDCTWGSGNVNDTCTEFTFEYNELYFLTHPAIFVEEHFPEDQDWQLLKPPLTLIEFEGNMRHEKGFYNMGLLTCLPATPLISTVNGKSVITIDGLSPNFFMFKLNGAQQFGLMTMENLGMKLEVYPQETGIHRLQIFTKPFHATDIIYTRAVEYILECNSVDKLMVFPKDLSNPVGPSWFSESKGFRQPSHPDPIINMPDGLCSVSFTLNKDMEALATLHTDGMRMTEDIKRRHIFKWQNKDKIVFRIQLPQAGTYVLKIFSRNQEDSSKSYSYVLDYLLSCTNKAVKWPVFPLVFTEWLNHYELIEPVAGVLPADQKVYFKLKVPGVSSVCVNDDREWPLTLSTEGFWEGFFNTTGQKEVSVLVQTSPKQNYYDAILEYQVAPKYTFPKSSYYRR